MLGSVCFPQRSWSVVIMLADPVKQCVFLNQHVLTTRTAGTVTKQTFTVGYPSIPNIPEYPISWTVARKPYPYNSRADSSPDVFRSRRRGLTAEQRFKSDGWGRTRHGDAIRENSVSLHRRPGQSI